MKKTTILFNILVILTIIVIFLIFFPKKSYIESKIEETPTVEEVFNTNIEQIKTAGRKYFEDKEGKVTLEELEKENLIAEIKDSNNEACNKDSYIKKEEDKTTIKLICNDKEEKIELTNEENKKLFCLYEYKKTEDKEYTDWSNWSDWQQEEVKENDLTKVETKIEEEPDGTEIKEFTEELSTEAIEHIKITCPQGYEEKNGNCIKKVELNPIKASILYTCKEGYSRNGSYCYNGETSEKAQIEYYCPSNQSNIEFELSKDKCKTYAIRYIEPIKKETSYTCIDGYNLDNKMCYKTEYYEEEVTNYKEVKYYRYKTREKIEKNFDIIWSRNNNKELLEKEYNITRKITCEF